MGSQIAPRQVTLQKAGGRKITWVSSSGDSLAGDSGEAWAESGANRR